MANRELVEILKQGSDVWNRWKQQQLKSLPIDLSKADLYRADLAGADLSRVDLREADLYGADLRKADLSEAGLSRADLTGANLCEANLYKVILIETHLNDANFNKANLAGADLREADLRKTSLYKANLTGADLREANLSGVSLDDADLREALFAMTIIANVNLCNAKGLAEINHQGPSTITLHTVQLPSDGSALHFLRGAGVSDEWIDLYRAQMMHPIQYHSCFISYAHQDNNLARRLHSDLQDKGVRCWFAPHDMHIGDKIRPRIDEAIHLQDKLLLILSEHSVDSNWVEHEVETALAKEHRDRRNVLFPIRLDDAILERPYNGWAATVQNERHIGDFTGWKDHDRYQAAFERLIRDLKKADE